jgi:hypothetical protein
MVSGRHIYTNGGVTSARHYSRHHWQLVVLSAPGSAAGCLDTELSRYRCTLIVSDLRFRSDLEATDPLLPAPVPDQGFCMFQVSPAHDLPSFSTKCDTIVLGNKSLPRQFSVHPRQDSRHDSKDASRNPHGEGECAWKGV